MKKNSPLTPGERIAHWRRIKGYSVRRLAREAGLWYSALSRIEHGKQEPTAQEVETIARVLGVGMSQWYGDTEARAS